MNIIEQIKENKTIESYFLYYIKWSYSKETLPAEPPANISKKELAKAGVIISNYAKARNELLVELQKKYDSIIQSNNLNINRIIIEVCEYYEDKYGKPAILKMTENKTAAKNSPEDIFKDMLKIQISNCEICRTPRLELKYQDLPIEQQNRFQYDANNYYLFCEKCNTYTVVFQTQ